MFHLKDRPIWRLILRTPRTSCYYLTHAWSSLPSPAPISFLGYRWKSNLTAGFRTPSTVHRAVRWTTTPNRSLWYPDLCYRAPPSGMWELSGTLISLFTLELTFHTQLPEGPNQIAWHCLTELSNDKQYWKWQWDCIRKTHLTQWNQFLQSTTIKSCMSGTGALRPCGEQEVVTVVQWWQLCWGQAQENLLTKPIDCVWITALNQSIHLLVLV